MAQTSSRRQQTDQESSREATGLADAMTYDGVLPEALVILVEA
jgi:hypothetical protein